MDDDDYTVLQAIEDVLETERSFHQTIRFFDSRNRSQLIALHMRNVGTVLAILREYMSQNNVARGTIQIPIRINTAAAFAASFMDPVPVIPSSSQIQSATETVVQVEDTTCSICQEEVTEATRLRECRHCFHADCIAEWFTMNTRCPVCRHDIRDLQRPTPVNNNVSRRGDSDE